MKKLKQKQPLSRKSQKPNNYLICKFLHLSDRLGKVFPPPHKYPHLSSCHYNTRDRPYKHRDDLMDTLKYERDLQLDGANSICCENMGAGNFSAEYISGNPCGGGPTRFLFYKQR